MPCNLLGFKAEKTVVTPSSPYLLPLFVVWMMGKEKGHTFPLARDRFDSDWQGLAQPGVRIGVVPGLGCKDNRTKRVLTGPASTQAFCRHPDIDAFPPHVNFSA